MTHAFPVCLWEVPALCTQNAPVIDHKGDLHEADGTGVCSYTLLSLTAE